MLHTFFPPGRAGKFPEGPLSRPKRPPGKSSVRNKPLKAAGLRTYALHTYNPLAASDLGRLSSIAPPSSSAGTNVGNVGGHCLNCLAVQRKTANFREDQLRRPAQQLLHIARSTILWFYTIIFHDDQERAHPSGLPRGPRDWCRWPVRRH